MIYLSLTSPQRLWMTQDGFCQFKPEQTIYVLYILTLSSPLRSMSHPSNIKEAGLMTSTSASHQGVIEKFWLHLSELSCCPSLYVIVAQEHCGGWGLEVDGDVGNLTRWRLMKHSEILPTGVRQRSKYPDCNTGNIVQPHVSHPVCLPDTTGKLQLQHGQDTGNYQAGHGAVETLFLLPTYWAVCFCEIRAEHASSFLHEKCCSSCQDLVDDEDEQHEPAEEAEEDVRGGGGGGGAAQLHSDHRKQFVQIKK